MQLYSKIKVDKGITEKIGYELQKDESTVPGASQYNQRLDSIVGFCGKKGDCHECDDECSIVIGNGEDAYEIIQKAHDEQQLAGYLALVVIVPLDERLPRIALVAHATCNRFTATWQRKQWQRMEALANELISPHIGWLEGHGSDGDERRAKLMKQDMCKLPTDAGRFGLNEPGFNMSARQCDGVIDGMHAQDPRHNVGKLYSHLDSSVRYLEFGNARATHEHVRTAWETFEASELGLPLTAVQRDDRMDKAGPAQCAGTRVRTCLGKMAAGDAGGAHLKPGKVLKHPEPTMHGTIDYLDMISRYIKMVFSKHASFEQRIEHAAYVVGLLRRWRQFLKHGKHSHAGVGVNFLPRQTYEHVLLSCFSVVLKILAHAERGSKYALALWLTGSNACEDAFSALGGFGRVLVMVRNFTFGGALESLSHQAIMEAYKVTGEDPLRFGKHRGHKQDIDMKHHEDVTADPADLSDAGHPANFLVAYAAAWRRGDEQAAATAERRGMKPPAGANGRRPDWWEKPYANDGDLSDLREADADEMGDEVLQQRIDGATGEPMGEQADIEPDVTHPAVAAHLTEEEEAVARAVAAADEDAQADEDAEESAEDAGDEVDLSSADATEPPPPPRLYRTPSPPPAPVQAAAERDMHMGGDTDDEETEEAVGVPLDRTTAAQLEALVERAHTARQDEEARQDGRQVQPKHKVTPTLTLPSELGRGQVYKRSLVAELNRMRPGEPLPVGRLEKMKVAVQAMRPGPSKAAKGAAEVVEEEEEEEEEERLARGVDFGMAFKGTGKKAKHVCWLGRVEKLFRPAGKSGKGKARTDSIKLDELKGKGYRVLASWYVRCKYKRGRYKHNVIVDSTVYSLDHLIGLVTLEYDVQLEEYVLEPLEEQLSSLTAATQRTEPAKPGKPSGRTHGEVEEANARQREREHSDYQPPPETATKRQDRDTRHARRHGASVLPAADSMLIADLRAELERRGKDTRGAKPFLVVRLEAARREDSAGSAEAAVRAEPQASEAVARTTTVVAEAMEVAVEGTSTAEAVQAVEVVEVAEAAEATVSEVEAEPDADSESEVEVVAVDMPPHDEPMDDLRDLSGDAITTTTMLRANAASRHPLGHPQYVFAQCSLSAARNLLRNEHLPRSFLVDRQAHGQGNDRSEQPDGEIRFPDWSVILRPLLRPGEVFVQFNPTYIGASDLLHDLRLAACSFASTTHVIAILRHETPIGGRVAFRRYDNDSLARRRGTYELTNARRLWTRCTMEGVTREGSALHGAVEAFRTRTRETVDLCSRTVRAGSGAARGMIDVDVDAALMGMPMS